MFKFSLKLSPARYIKTSQKKLSITIILTVLFPCYRGGYMSPLAQNTSEDVKKVWVGTPSAPLLVAPGGCLVAVERAQLVDTQQLCDIQRQARGRISWRVVRGMDGLNVNVIVHWVRFYMLNTFLRNLQRAYLYQWKSCCSYGIDMTRCTVQSAIYLP